MSSAYAGGPTPSASGAPPVPRRVAVAGAIALLVLLVAGLLWAKWVPYAARVATLSGTHRYPGAPIFSSASATPTLGGALGFAGTYFAAVWKAAVVGIVVAAALEALVPKQWLLRVMSRRSRVGQGVVGGLLSLPSMMCTCCTSPVAIGLRRRGVQVGASVAYWLGNPLLNPAVLVFLALTLPWPFVTVRALVGVAVVVGAAVLAARVAGRRADADLPVLPETPDARTWAELGTRFVRTLGRYLLVLVPEYVVLVLATGLLSGWLSNFAGLDRAAGPLALLVVGLVGAALVIPTGGEIPVVVGLVAAGASFGVAGVLLVTLPALSLPSIVMVARSFSWRVVASVAGLVVLGGVLAGGLLTVLA